MCKRQTEVFCTESSRIFVFLLVGAILCKVKWAWFGTKRSDSLLRGSVTPFEGFCCFQTETVKRIFVMLIKSLNLTVKLQPGSSRLLSWHSRDDPFESRSQRLICKRTFLLRLLHTSCFLVTRDLAVRGFCSKLKPLPDTHNDCKAAFQFVNKKITSAFPNRDSLSSVTVRRHYSDVADVCSHIKNEEEEKKS